MVTSPAIGAYLGRIFGDNLVIALATAVAVFDVIFILIFVPESLPEKCRSSSWGSTIAWDKADPFGVGLCELSFPGLALIFSSKFFMELNLKYQVGTVALTYYNSASCLIYRRL